jgi:hypothetical protein
MGFSDKKLKIFSDIFIILFQNNKFSKAYKFSNQKILLKESFFTGIKLKNFFNFFNFLKNQIFKNNLLNQ